MSDAPDEDASAGGGRYLVDGDRRDIAAPKGSPLADGVTDLSFATVRTGKVRLTFTQPAGKATRLAGFKLFGA